MRSCRYSVMAQASDTPSYVEVPRPISSRMTRLRDVALFRMLAASGNDANVSDWVGRVFRGLVDTTDPTATHTDWTQLIGKGANGTAPHADTRTMVWVGTSDTDGYILEGDDGGVFRL